MTFLVKKPGSDSTESLLMSNQNIILFSNKIGNEVTSVQVQYRIFYSIHTFSELIMSTWWLDPYCFPSEG